MPTLYVENVPEDLYEALRTRARDHRKSMAAEVLTLLEENVPTTAELRRRKSLWNLARQIRSRPSPASGSFATSEIMLREDRDR